MRYAWLPPLWVALWAGPVGAAAQTPSDPLFDPRSESRSEAPAEVAAQATLTLDEAIERAAQGRPETAAARSDAEAAQAAVAQAGTYANPVLSAEVEGTRQNDRTTTVLLSQTFEWGGQRVARQDAARFAHEAALARQSAWQQQLRAEVTAVFVEALVAQERLRLAESAVTLAERASDAARKRVIAGKASPVDETRARLAEASVRVEARRAVAELRAAWRALTAAMGSAMAAPAALPHLSGPVALPEVPSEATLLQCLASAAAWQQAQLEVGRLGALARLERAKRTPDVTLGLGTQRSDDQGQRQTVLTLSMPLPLFNTNGHAEVEAQRRQDKARHDADALALKLRTEVFAAQARLEVAVAEAQALEREVLPGAQQAHEASARGFELGKFGLIELLDSQRTLLQARTQHLKAVADAHRAAAEIERWLAHGTN